MTSCAFGVEFLAGLRRDPLSNSRVRHCRTQAYRRLASRQRCPNGLSPMRPKVDRQMTTSFRRVAYLLIHGQRCETHSAFRTRPVVVPATLMFGQRAKFPEQTNIMCKLCDSLFAYSVCIYRQDIEYSAGIDRWVDRLPTTNPMPTLGRL